MTIDEQIVQAIVRKLLAADIPDVAESVFEARAWTLAEGDAFPAIDVMPLVSAPQEFGAQPAMTREELKIRLTIFVSDTGDGVTVTSKAADIRAAAHRAVFADRTLGGLCAAVFRGPARWKQEAQLLALEQDYQAIYVTRAADLEVRG